MAKIDTYLTVRQVLSKLGLQAQDMAAHPRKADKSYQDKTVADSACGFG